MSIRMDVRSDEPLEDGHYEAVLESLELKETKYGERLLWLFSVPEHRAEVAGFTSLSPSKQANAFLWATALNSEVASKTSWGSEDVVGQRCILVVEAYEGERGRKNKVVRVKPATESKAG